MLLSLRVSSPSRLKGISLGEHMRTGFDWEDRGEAARAVGRILRWEDIAHSFLKKNSHNYRLQDWSPQPALSSAREEANNSGKKLKNTA